MSRGQMWCSVQRYAHLVERELHVRVSRPAMRQVRIRSPTSSCYYCWNDSPVNTTTWLTYSAIGSSSAGAAHAEAAGRASTIGLQIFGNVWNLYVDNFYPVIFLCVCTFYPNRLIFSGRANRRKFRVCFKKHGNPLLTILREIPAYREYQQITPLSNPLNERKRLTVSLSNTVKAR